MRSRTDAPASRGAVRGELDARRLARAAVAVRWPGETEWRCLDALWERESGWDASAQNGGSTAYGVGQLLRQTYRAHGVEGRPAVREQVRAGLDYVAERYGSPCGAWRFWRAHRWY